jgi:hypothetical protein
MRFSKTDSFAIAAVCVLSSVFFALFYADANSTFARVGQERLGVVSFRKNAATRREPDSLRWETLKNRSDVFGGDTLRTSGGSEASVLFDDGASFDMAENSMLRLGGRKTGDIELASGAFRVTAGKGSSRLVRAGDSVIEIAADSDVSFLSEKDSLVVDVSAGRASVKDGNAPAFAVGERDVLRVNTKTGAATVERKKVEPLFPRQGERLVSRDGSVAIRFSGRAEEIPESVDVSADPSFSNVVARDSVPAFAFASDGSFYATLPVGAGTWYWRAVTASGEASPVRRFSLLASAPPVPTWPPEGAVIRHRSSSPAVRFSWGESPGADSYVLELSRSSDGQGEIRRLRTTLTSQTVADFADGVWFWRVVPEYASAVIGTAPAISFRSITIEHSDEMEPVVPLAPLDGNLYALSSFGSAGIFFSWKPADGAAHYELRVYDSSSDGKPLASFRSDVPWLRLDAKSAPFLRAEGARQWAVAWIDSDGAVSPEGIRRSFTGVNEQVAVRPTYPPDGFVAASSLLDAVRFSWKSAVRARTKFLVARDSSFASPLVDRDVDSGSLIGLTADAGDLFWKVRVYNVDGTSFLETEPRRLRVVESLPPPRLVGPESLPEIVVLDGEPVTLSWSSVPYATRYSLALFGAEAGGRPLFSLDRVEETSLLIPSGSLPAGAYRVELRACADSSSVSTRLSGSSSSYPISIRNVARLSLGKPAQGASIDGIAAWRNGVRLEWFSPSKPDSLSLSVWKDGVAYPVRFSWSGGSSFVLPRLTAGTYTWKISATSGSLDISPRASGRFTVRSIAPFPAPTAVSPANGSSLDASYFSARKSVSFSWSPIPDAAGYRFRLFAMPGRRVVASAERLASPSFVLSDLRLLDRGEFVWEVSAEDPSGKAGPKRVGKVASFRFSVTLPKLAMPKSVGDAEFYAY